MKPNLTHRVNPLNGKPLGRGRATTRRLRTANADLRPVHAGARTVLEANARVTQAALDEYLATVADPRVLKPLRAARDGARDALAAFSAKEATKP